MTDNSPRIASDTEMDVSDSDPRGTVTRIQMLEEDNQRLQEDLDKCKWELYELRREDRQVADTTIEKGYVRICENIVNWVEKVIYEEKTDFKDRFIGILQKEPQKLANLELCKLGRREHDGRGHTVYHVERSSHKWMKWLSKYDYCSSVVVSLVIWRYLYSRIYKEPFPIGTFKDDRKDDRKDDPKRPTVWDHATLFKDIQDVMESQDKKGTSLRTRRWMSETLTAMVATPSFESRQKKYSDDLFKGLMSELKDWISIETLKKEHKSHLRSEVFDLSVKLHQDMECARQCYDIEPPKISRGEAPGQPQPWTLKNIQNWKSMNRNDPNWVPFHCLFPALYRLGPDKERELELVPAVVVACKREQEQSATARTSPVPDQRDEIHTLGSHLLKHQVPESSSASISSSQSDHPSGGISSWWRRSSKQESPEPMPRPSERHCQAVGGHSSSPASPSTSRRNSQAGDPGQSSGRSARNHRSSTKRSTRSRPGSVYSSDKPLPVQPTYPQPHSEPVAIQKLGRANTAPGLSSFTGQGQVLESTSENLEDPSHRPGHRRWFVDEETNRIIWTDMMPTDSPSFLEGEQMRRSPSESDDSRYERGPPLGSIRHDRF